MSLKNVKRALLISVLPISIIFVSRPADAGLGSPTADIEVNNLRVGQTYDLTAMGNMPFRITASYRRYRVKITLINPATAQCRPGFEPVPDITWISVTKDMFDLLPGETGSTDITISIPDDEKYLGKNFETRILAATIPETDLADASGASFGIGVMGSLRFRIAPKPLTEAEKTRFAKAKFKSVSMGLTPNDLVIEALDTGKEINVEKSSGKFLKLVNTGDEPLKVMVRSIPFSGTGIQVPQGWESAPEGAYLKPKKEKVKIKPLQVKKIPFSIFIPANPEFAGKKYIFIVEAFVEDKLTKTSYRSKVYVPTK